MPQPQIINPSTTSKKDIKRRIELLEQDLITSRRYGRTKYQKELSLSLFYARQLNDEYLKSSDYLRVTFEAALRDNDHDTSEKVIDILSSFINMPSSRLEDIAGLYWRDIEYAAKVKGILARFHFEVFKNGHHSASNDFISNAINRLDFEWLKLKGEWHDFLIHIDEEPKWIDYVKNEVEEIRDKVISVIPKNVNVIERTENFISQVQAVYDDNDANELIGAFVAKNRLKLEDDYEQVEKQVKLLEENLDESNVELAPANATESSDQRVKFEEPSHLYNQLNAISKKKADLIRTAEEKSGYKLKE